MAAYGTDQGFTDYLASQGLVLPVCAPSPEVLRELGSAYVDAAYGYRLQCSQKTGGWEQELEFPRTGHRVNGQLVPSDLIPAAWVNASYRAGYLNAITPGWSFSGGDPGRLVKRQKVDTLEREFFSPGDAGASKDIAPGMPYDAVINGLIKPWLCSGVRRGDSLFRVI